MAGRGGLPRSSLLSKIKKKKKNVDKVEKQLLKCHHMRIAPLVVKRRIRFLSLI